MFALLISFLIPHHQPDALCHLPSWSSLFLASRVLFGRSKLLALLRFGARLGFAQAGGRTVAGAGTRRGKQHEQGRELPQDDKGWK